MMAKGKDIKEICETMVCRENAYFRLMPDNGQTQEDGKIKNIGDMALIACFQQQFGEYTARIPLKSSILEKLPGKTMEGKYEEFARAAKDNIRKNSLIIPLEKMAGILMSADSETEVFESAWNYGDGEPIVVGSRTGIGGAATAVVLADEIANEIGDFYMIPSSVHETILSPVSASIDPEELKKMVKEINQTIPREDFLSNNIMLYSGGAFENA